MFRIKIIRIFAIISRYLQADCYLLFLIADLQSRFLKTVFFKPIFKALYRCKDCLEPFDYFKCIWKDPNMSSFIQKEQKGKVLDIRLNRPDKFNSFVRQMALDLQAALSEAQENEECREDNPYDDDD